MIIERIAMWICRRCAAHVKDDVLECPCCATPAPARLQPELCHHVSDEVQESPRRREINWLTHKAIPNLRKRAQSPWSWVLFGFVFGLGCGVVDFRGAWVSSRTREFALLQPFLCGMAVALVFGLLAAVLQWRRQRWQIDTHFIEIAAILGFFLLPIIAVIDAFTHHRGWESLHHLASTILPAIALGVFLAWIAAMSTGIMVPLLKNLSGLLARRFRTKALARELPPHAYPAEADSVGQQSTASDTELSDKIIAEEDRVSSQRTDNFHIRQESDPAKQ